MRDVNIVTRGIVIVSNMAAQTSVDAYHQLIKERKITPRCKILLSAYLEHGDLADFEVADILGWHPSQVSARRGDLVNAENTGLIVDKGRTKYNPNTNRNVVVWSVNLERQSKLF